MINTMELMVLVIAAIKQTDSNNKEGGVMRLMKREMPSIYKQELSFIY